MTRLAVVILFSMAASSASTSPLGGKVEGPILLAQSSEGGRLVGRWLGLQKGVSFPLSCDSGEVIDYGVDGRWRGPGAGGTWRLRGGELIETVDGRSYPNPITWKGPDTFVKTFPGGRRMTFRRCP